ncbi:MAG: type IV secretion system protein [Alphaproteobacteria bacterium]|nr:type IV secretion system protein [Alphaproteobacteria bacterium]
MFLLILFWGGGWLVWKSFKPQLTTGILAVRSVQMDVASVWMNDNDVIQVPMPYNIDNDRPLHAKMGDEQRVVYLPVKFGTWHNFVKTARAENVQGDHLRVLSYVAMYSWRWFTIALFAGLFIWVMFKGPTSYFRRIMSLEGLMNDQAKMFKVIQPFLKFNPNKMPIRAPGSPVPVDLPMFAEALSPEEWLAVNEIPVKDNIPEKIPAERAFAKQLGPRWKGWKALPPELQVLLAAFCLKASRKRDEADAILGRLACCWDHQSGLKLRRDMKLVGDARKILRDDKLSEKTLGNCNRHAYITTAMMRALNTAREEGGVLAPAMFVWLRAHNRGLWYPLNNLGRQAFHMEALGVAAHYRAEKQVNRPILKPRVMDAVDGLIEFQKNTILTRPIPPVDYGPKGKKKAA